MSIPARGQRVRLVRDFYDHERRATIPAGTEATILGTGIDARYGFVTARLDDDRRVVLTVPPYVDPVAVPV